MPRFKDDYQATRADAIKMLRRFRRITKPHGYVLGIFGSCVLVGRGHDIDMLCVAAEPTVSVADLAALLLKRHAKTLYRYEVEESYCWDVFLNFVTHDGFYIDFYIKGEPQ